MLRMEGFPLYISGGADILNTPGSQLLRQMSP